MRINFVFLFSFFILSYHVFATEPNSEDTVIKTKFIPPQVPFGSYFVEFFSSVNDLSSRYVNVDIIISRWFVSQAKKDGVDEALAKYDGEWSVEVPESSALINDYGLVLKSKARHHAISSKMQKSFDFSEDTLVVQYEVKFQNGMDCGGAYVKLLSDSANLDLINFNDKTPYTIMFGPDKCGFDHKDLINEKYEEKHSKKVSQEIDKYFTDKKTHLYSLVIRSDNTFEIYVDQSLINSGNLLIDFTPPVNPDKEIDDPDDKKPNDWDERPKIVDETAKKPDDWDEDIPEFINDETAVKPEGWLDSEPAMISDTSVNKPGDWDTKIDGEWEAPKIDNPKCVDAPGCGEWKIPKVRNPSYKGKWSPPMIDNPAYKGQWKPKRIPNPNYFEDNHPYKMTPFSAVGLELWSMTEEIVFDNFIIVNSKKLADEFASETWKIKKEAERIADPSAQSVVDAVRETYKEKPWMVIAIVCAIVLPIIFICIYFCRSPKVSSRSDTYLSAQHKKTDAPTADDSPIVSEKQSPSANSSAASDSGSSSVEEVEIDNTSTHVSSKLSPKSSPLKSVQSSASGDNSSDKFVLPSKPVIETDDSDIDTQDTSKQNLRKRRSRKEN